MNIPVGYMQDAQGNLVPEAKIKPQHKIEDELVRRLTASAQSLHNVLAEFKKTALSETMNFRSLVAEQYGAKKGGAKGNMTLRSFDGAFEVQIAVSETLTFGVELQAAKELVDNCLERWSEGSNDNIKVLVTHAFHVNKQGRIDTQQVLGLRRLEMDGDEEWTRAMEAISDAVRVDSSKTYIRFYQFDPASEIKSAISLDLAAV